MLFRSVGQILQCMHDNVQHARSMIVQLIKALPARREPSPIDSAMNGVIITAPEAREPGILAKLCRLSALPR